MSSSANSEETDPDTDDELQQIESESEPLRLEIIKLLSLVFIDQANENQTAQEASIKLMIAQKSVPLVIKEMSQVNNMRSLQSCQEVLVQITLQSDELCSSILANPSMIRTLDAQLLNGNFMHKRLALILLQNFINNSTEDALKILDDPGILRRVMENIH